LPYCMANYDGYLDVQIYAGILKMTHALSAYSLVDASTFADLKSAHSIRMLMLLNRINSFGTNVAKRKRYNLEELNEMFDTNYKTIPEFNRRVLSVAKAELDEKSKLTFLFEQRKDKEERTVGRAKVVEVIIDLIERKDYQPKLF
jgi:plasmid replication initiation protein